MKNNKKKMIILTMTVGMIGIIFTVIMVNKINDGGRKIAKEIEGTSITEVASETVNMNDCNEVNNVTEPETENICEVETEAPTELETESEPEPETQIEETTELVVENTTESATEAKKEPAKESTSNKETNAQKEGGLKDGDSFTLGVTYTSSDNNKKKELTIEEKLLIDEFAEEGGYYRYNDTIYNAVLFRDEVKQVKDKWIKENFGTNFTYNGITFGWNDEIKEYYWVYKYDTIHYMTSATTSRDEYFCKKMYSYRIADYLGFYGTDSARYHSEDSLDDCNLYADYNADFTTVTDVYGNNFGYLSQLGWTEVKSDDGITRDWNMESPEGIPARIKSNGYISVYIQNVGDKNIELTYFTIEEYNEFINNNTWRVSSYSGSRGFAFEEPENMEKYIRKYIIVD